MREQNGIDFSAIFTWERELMHKILSHFLSLSVTLPIRFLPLTFSCSFSYSFVSNSPANLYDSIRSHALSFFGRDKNYMLARYLSHRLLNSNFDCVVEISACNFIYRTFEDIFISFSTIGELRSLEFSKSSKHTKHTRLDVITINIFNYILNSLRVTFSLGLQLIRCSTIIQIEQNKKRQRQKRMRCDMQTRHNEINVNTEYD